MRRLPAAVDCLPRRVRVAAAIEALSERERNVLALCLLERLSPIEAAGALRTTAREVESLFASALERITADEAAPRAGRTIRRAA